MVAAWIKEYMDTNRVTVIGKGFSDIIVKNEEEFLQALYSTKQHKVVSVLWWDYHKTDERESCTLGYGGPIDSNHREYMWSETLIEHRIPDNWGAKEIIDYLKETKDRYLPRVLVPSFTVERNYEEL